MKNSGVTLVVAFTLAGTLLAGAASAKTYDGVGTDVSVSTGQAGTTSGITGADMNESDETTGEGQSSADQIVRTSQAEPADQDSDVDQPEEIAPNAGNNAGGGSDNSGVPQSSNSEGSGNDSSQQEEQN